MELAKMALNRGESMDEIRLESYSEALVEEFAGDDDTFAVLKRLSRTPREEFEPKIPELSSLIEKITRHAKQRVWDETREQREEDRRRADSERAAKFIQAREEAFRSRKEREERDRAPSPTTELPNTPPILTEAGFEYTPVNLSRFGRRS